jgi:hypothetical protein
MEEIPVVEIRNEFLGSMFFVYDSEHLRCYAVIQTTNQNINHQCHGKPKKQCSNLVYSYAIFTGKELPAFRGEHSPTVFRV